MNDENKVPVRLGDCVELWDRRTGQVLAIDDRWGRALVRTDTEAQEDLWLLPHSFRIYGPPRPEWEKED